jgi:hypothetical protein
VLLVEHRTKFGDGHLALELETRDSESDALRERSGIERSARTMNCAQILSERRAALGCLREVLFDECSMPFGRATECDGQLTVPS